MAVATLKRLQNNFGAIVAKLLDIDRLGLQQIGLHADFLSIPPARYTGKAGEAPQRDASRLGRSEEHTSELQSPCNLVCRLLLEKKKNDQNTFRAPSLNHARYGKGQLQLLSCDAEQRHTLL